MKGILKVRIPQRQPTGAALVIVLSLLVVLIILVVAFLSRIGSERTAARTYASAVSTRVLADTAVNLVQGMINDVTTLGTSYAWASQPGMVRSFSQNGDLYRAYKLYSSSKMISDTVDLTADLPPAIWKNEKAGWVDLNEPVQSSHGSGLVYPILDPAAKTLIGSVGPVEGFALHSSPGYNSSQAEASDNNPAPMAVRWLYILHDGQLTLPSATSGNEASFSGSTIQPSKDNPIVGRVAFWTDDESTKININTAGEGTAWDTPRANSEDEKQFGIYQPVNGEWLRYPGHPGTTCISSVFPWQGIDEILRVQQSTSLSPLYNWGGSKAATVPTSSVTDALPPKDERLYASVDELIFTPNRTTRTLFQTDAALAKQVLESRRFFLTAHSRAPETNMFNLPKIAVWPIYKLTNPSNPTSFDLTRTTGFDRQIAKCSTISGVPYYFQRANSDDISKDFSLIGQNLSLYNYLDVLTQTDLPASGGNFSTKYGTDDRRQLLTSMLDYIRCTNLFDDRLGTNLKFTDERMSSYGVNQGHGCVAPLTHPSYGSKGYGRFNTVSEFGLLFIATGQADDPATASDDESFGSNYPPGTPASDLPAGAQINHTLPSYTPPAPSTALASGQRRIQAAILLELFSPSGGWTQNRMDCTVRIKGMNALTVTNASGVPESLGFSNTIDVHFSQATGHVSFRENGAGGIQGMRNTFLQASAHRPAGYDPMAFPGTSSTRIVSRPVTINSSTGSMSFSGGTVTVEIYPWVTGLGTASDYAQKFTIDLPGGAVPAPKLVTEGTTAFATSSIVPDTSPSNVSFKSMVTSKENWWGFYAYLPGVPAAELTEIVNGVKIPDRYVRRLDYLTDKIRPASIGRYDESAGTGISGLEGSGAIIRSGFDVVRTVYPSHGDYRITAAKRDVPSSDFTTDTGGWGMADMQYHYLSDGTGVGYIPNFQGSQGYAQDVAVSPLRYADIPKSATLPATGDFDAMPSYMPDGPYINKPDEGNIYYFSHPTLTTKDYPSYFFQYGLQYTATPTFFSPNRIIPSPVMMGSLPTAAVSGTPWQTLLFRPQNAHPGAASPKDHYLLELFWMPVVEPYAISEPFSTAGKINLNYQILPFTYIERSTGLHAVLKSEKIGAIPNTLGPDYKTPGTDTSRATPTRLPVDVEQTLAQFKETFDQGKIFRSASEICDIHIVAEGVDASENANAAMKTFWEEHALTGENTRERIYATLYPRLTTKSNTFTVHVRAQNIRKRPSSDPLVFDEGKDLVDGEYRGATIIERFVDPNIPGIPNYEEQINNLSAIRPLDDFYRWRIVQNRQFLP